VKTGIVHLFCARYAEFARKQRRRIRDFLYFAQEKRRTYPWDRQRAHGVVLFALATASVLPLAVQAAIGYWRRPDRAWLCHAPFAGSRFGRTASRRCARRSAAAGARGARDVAAVVGWRRHKLDRVAH
jgi:hypothetical protein